MRSGKGAFDKIKGLVTAPMSQWSLTFEVRKRTTSEHNPYDEYGSQWSLTFEVRKRFLLAHRPCPDSLVAMEPDL